MKCFPFTRSNYGYIWTTLQEVWKLVLSMNQTLLEKKKKVKI